MTDDSSQTPPTPPTDRPQKTAYKQRDFARRLALYLIEERASDQNEKSLFGTMIEQHDEHNNPLPSISLREALDEMIPLLWPIHKGPPTKDENKRRNQLMADLQKTPQNIQETVIDILAHTGQLHQMAGLLAREAILTSPDTAPDETNPIKKLFSHGRSKVRRQIDQVLEQLATPRFEMSFTGHPTNTNSVLSMRTQRALADELSKPVLDWKTILPALKTFAQTPLLPMKDGKATPLTVQEETATMLYFLGNVYNDLPGAYHEFDREIESEYKDKYKREDLKLNYNFHSWGSSGDKDGNQKVNGDTTLAAVYAHRTEILVRYADELEHLGIKTPQAEAVKAAAKKLAGAPQKHFEQGPDGISVERIVRSGGLNDQLQHLVASATKDNPIKAEIFDQHSRDLQQATAALDLETLEKEVKDFYTHGHDDLMKPVINLRIALHREMAAQAKAIEESGSDTAKAQQAKKTHQPVIARFEEELKQAQKKMEEPLDLLRRVRTFGFHFSHIEYRETAEEYERVLALIDPQTPDNPKAYGALMKPIFEIREKLVAEHEQKAKALDEKRMDDAETHQAEITRLEEALDKAQKQAEPGRQAALTDLLQHPDKLQSLLANVHESLEKAAGQPYSTKDAHPIAYQTLKRMELARDFPDLIQNNVLAECQDTSNMLEALVLQQAVAKDGKRATLGVIPLFEEHTTLKLAPDIIENAVKNDFYRAHLAEVAKAHGTPIAQQVQLAHSDNSKRAGVPAARALVYKAHDDLRKRMKKINLEMQRENPKLESIAMQFFEGGSQSDAYRGGVRSISGSINEFGLHDFAKMTYQGGDLLNYFNLPYSTQRLLTKSMTTQVSGIQQEKKSVLSHVSSAIIQAFDNNKKTYIEKWFLNDSFLSFLNKIKYGISALLGNFSTRAPKRDDNGEVAAALLTDINKTRAIGISEALQHAEVAATWLGIGGIEDELRNARGIGHTPKERNVIYNKSPVFEDIIDRLMYGLMRSDLRFVTRITAEKGADGQMHEHKLIEPLRKEYAEAFKLCIEAYTGESIEYFFEKHKKFFEERHLKPDLTDSAALKALVESDALRHIIRREIFPHVEDTLGDQQRFLDLAHHMENWEVAHVEEGKPVPDQQRLYGSLVHNMLDTVHHGRLPLIDDPSYAKLHCKKYGIQREWALKNMEMKKGQASDTGIPG